MSGYSRYAIYYLPPKGPLAQFGASWLGWDAASGAPVPQPEGAAAMTADPSKYGFHGTLKPPFRLAGHRTAEDLKQAVAILAARHAPVRCGPLRLSRLGRFLALVPSGETEALAQLASACVTGLDDFRGPPAPTELERRRKAGLSQRQEALLLRWGYPYVLDQFRFHLTLTGRLPADTIAQAEQRIAGLMPSLPEAFAIDSLCLCGERQDGRFELVHRYALTG
ncbi:MAG: DUF1045 domain-containing protein [Roseivivax sp.]|nr:DUF1045 domain-containing protein [Roseivivax sp.]